MPFKLNFRRYVMAASATRSARRGGGKQGGTGVLSYMYVHTCIRADCLSIEYPVVRDCGRPCARPTRRVPRLHSTTLVSGLSPPPTCLKRFYTCINLYFVYTCINLYFVYTCINL